MGAGGRDDRLPCEVGDEGLGKLQGDEPETGEGGVEEGERVESEGAVGRVVQEQPLQELSQRLWYKSFTFKKRL